MESFEYHLELSKDHLNNGRIHSAIEEIDQAIALEPRSSEAFAIRGDALRELGLYHNALEDYRYAGSLGATIERIALGQGICLLFLERYDDALEWLDVSIDENPESAVAYFWRGMVFARRPVGIQGELDFERTLQLIELCPEDAYLREWRLYHRDGSVKWYMHGMFRGWGYSAAQIRQAAIGDPLLATGDSHILANVYDDAIIALSFAQFIVDGFIDDELSKRVEKAILRQADLDVLEFRSGSNPKASAAIAKIASAVNRMPRQAESS
ncbi:MAG: tetratricopeptide repeat protein [Candidatus Obscuribacterales bacterium]